MAVETYISGFTTHYPFYSLLISFILGIVFGSIPIRIIYDIWFKDKIEECKKKPRAKIAITIMCLLIILSIILILGFLGIGILQEKIASVSDVTITQDCLEYIVEKIANKTV